MSSGSLDYKRLLASLYGPKLELGESISTLHGNLTLLRSGKPAPNLGLENEDSGLRILWESF